MEPCKLSEPATGWFTQAPLPRSPCRSSTHNDGGPHHPPSIEIGEPHPWSVGLVSMHDSDADGEALSGKGTTGEVRRPVLRLLPALLRTGRLPYATPTATSSCTAPPLTKDNGASTFPMKSCGPLPCWEAGKAKELLQDLGSLMPRWRWSKLRTC